MPESPSLIGALPRFVDDPDFVLYVGDACDVLSALPEASIDCCVTSPPYWGLRDYGHDGQLGLERTLGEYVAAVVAVFGAVRRVLRPEGTLWLNLGDSYNAYNGGAGPGSKISKTQTEARPQLETGFGLRSKDLKPKDLVGIPWRVALALQEDGWYLRSDIIWAKPNPMPESIQDRPTKAHEYVFLLAKSARYYFDQDAVRETSITGDTRRPYGSEGAWAMDGRPREQRHGGEQRRGKTWDERKAAGAPSRHGVDGAASAEPGLGTLATPANGRNVRSVWEIATRPYPEAHFATFPIELPRRCIAAGCPVDGTVLDPFMGSGTTALAARGLGRKAVGIELNPEYAELCARRLQQQSLLAVSG